MRLEHKTSLNGPESRGQIVRILSVVTVYQFIRQVSVHPFEDVLKPVLLLSPNCLVTKLVQSGDGGGLGFKLGQIGDRLLAKAAIVAE